MTVNNSEKLAILEKELRSTLARFGTATVQTHRFKEVWPSLTQNDLKRKIQQWISDRNRCCKIYDADRHIDVWDENNPAWQKSACAGNRE